MRFFRPTTSARDVWRRVIVGACAPATLAACTTPTVEPTTSDAPAAGTSPSNGGSPATAGQSSATTGMTPTGSGATSGVNGAPNGGNGAAAGGTATTGAGGTSGAAAMSAGAGTGGAPSGGTSADAGNRSDAGNGSDAGAGGAGGSGEGGAPVGPAPALESVLLFSRTTGFRHDSIPAGIDAITALGEANDFAVVATEDASAFDAASLAEHDVVVWLNTTGDILDDTQKAALEGYIRGGGGWVGIHSASDTEFQWAWFGQLVGAYFKSHPAIQTAAIDVEIADHASTAHLPVRFEILDEWYNFTTNPRDAVNVLMALDEASYAPGADAMGDHPIAWFHEFDGGRSWYTALGHRSELYADDRFVNHVLGGIRWAAGVDP